MTRSSCLTTHHIRPADGDVQRQTYSKRMPGYVATPRRQPSRSPLLFRALAVGALFSFSSATFSAQLDVNARAIVNLPEGQIMDERPLTAATEPIQTSILVGGGQGGFPGSAQGSAYARAGYGWLGVGAGAGAIGPDDFSGAQYSAFADASASWMDTLTIQRPTANFATGTVRFFMELRGLNSLPRVDDGEYGIVEYRLQASVGCATPGCTIDGFGQISFNPPRDAAIQVIGESLVDSVVFYSDPVQVIFNQPMSLAVSLSALTQAYAFVPGRVEANFDAYGTMTWGGFLEVLDSEGNPVTNYTVVSDSTVDWSKGIQAPPVPEPSIALMTVFGILVLVLAPRIRIGTRGV